MSASLAVIIAISNADNLEQLEEDIRAGNVGKQSGMGALEYALVWQN